MLTCIQKFKMIWHSTAVRGIRARTLLLQSCTDVIHVLLLVSLNLAGFDWLNPDGTEMNLISFSCQMQTHFLCKMTRFLKEIMQRTSVL